MKTNSLNFPKIQQILEDIQGADIYELDDSPYLHSCEINDNDLENSHSADILLRFSWETDGEIFEVEFSAENLSEATFEFENINKNLLILMDFEGNRYELSLYNLTPKNFHYVI